MSKLAKIAKALSSSILDKSKIISEEISKGTEIGGKIGNVAGSSIGAVSGSLVGASLSGLLEGTDGAALVKVGNKAGKLIGSKVGKSLTGVAGVMIGAGLGDLYGNSKVSLAYAKNAINNLKAACNTDNVGNTLEEKELASANKPSL